MRLKPGDIILIDFPFTIPHQSKVRPAVVITETKDKYGDVVVCAISSVFPAKLGKREVAINSNHSDFKQTGLRVDSIIKIDRIATLRKVDIITKIGNCPSDLWEKFIAEFQKLAQR
jgi:mRNA interferase MazF